MPHLYNSRPIMCEAAHWNGSQPKATEIIDWILKFGGTANFKCGQQCCDNELAIKVMTRQGISTADPQDYIIRDLKTGEFYPCKPDTFEFKYEKMAEEHV